MLSTLLKKIIILLALSNISHSSELTICPKHLLKARDSIMIQTPIEKTEKDASFSSEMKCFEFVNRVLRLTLSDSAFQELNQLHNDLLLSLKPEHRYEEIIPYHYFLISSKLRENQNNIIHWRTDDLFNIRAGDLFMYIDPNYDPDPSKRPPGQSSGTHVALVYDVIHIEPNESITICVIDSSTRKKGRGYTPHFYQADPHKCGLTKGGIAYSIITLKIQTHHSKNEKIIWKCTILGQRKSLKHATLLRPVVSS